MEFSDIVALAKQGYKPADIKELLAIELPKEEPEKAQPEIPEPKDHDDDEVRKEDSRKEQPEDSDKDKEIEELRKALAAAQDLNTRKNIGDDNPKSNDEIITDIISTFF